MDARDPRSPRASGDRAFLAEADRGMGFEAAYAGALSFLRRRYTRDLAGADVVVAGVPLDLATSNRPGARFGPAAIRAASAQLAWGKPWPWPFDPTDRLAVVDWGDFAWDHGRPEAIPAAIEAQAHAVLATGARLLALGGDHFISYPLLKALRARHDRPLALVHFDAHSDTWQNGDGAAERRLDHGSMFLYAAEEGLIDPARSIHVGVRTHNDDAHGFSACDASFVHERGAAATAAAIREAVGDSPVYLTFDVDCLDPSMAPGTGTPVVGGLSTREARAVLRQLEGLYIAGMDVVEVAPVYDVSQITALAAATLALDMLCLAAAGPRFDAKAPTRRSAPASAAMPAAKIAKPGMELLRSLGPDERELVLDGFRACEPLMPHAPEVHWINVFYNGAHPVDFPRRGALDAWVRRAVAEAYRDWPEVHILSYGYMVNPVGSTQYQPFHCDYSATSSNLFVPLTRATVSNATQYLNAPLARATVGEVDVIGEIDAIMDAEGALAMEVSQLVCRPFCLLKLNPMTPHRGVPNRDDHDRVMLWVTVDSHPHALAEETRSSFYTAKAARPGEP
jgi:agmatinase